MSDTIKQHENLKAAKETLKKLKEEVLNSKTPEAKAENNEFYTNWARMVLDFEAAIAKGKYYC